MIVVLFVIVLVGISLFDVFFLLVVYKIEKLLFVDVDGKLCGLFIFKDFVKIDKYFNVIKDL